MKYNINLDISLKENPYPGSYIALEGIDGSGKTTQVELLAKYFRSLGKEVVTTREPRKEGLIGDLVQKVLLGKEKLPSVSLQYLFSADRSAHHEELVEPSLKEGKIVISDRCFWSAIVYGILDRTGGKYDTNVSDLLLISQSILSMYHQFIIPDHTFYLRISLETAIKRLSGKKETVEIYEEKSKLEKLITGYDFLEKKFSDNIITLSGEGDTGMVTKRILERIKDK
ncbi:MAG: dTMP kinase [Candidatus Levybacteria bacterium]|nr:dTMP kinase [Candidatus Levybacteria bacterium]MBP9815033.1 dTMP kinase [Candidatus Levybacteria bacterium]